MIPTVIDLFCGAGGLSEGFRQAGFHVLAGNDFDDYAGETYALTHKDAVFIPGPIENLSVKTFLKTASLKKGELTCLIGGPPCQGYSVYNHQRGMHDDRSSLYLEYLRLVEGLAPQWIVLENVTGITSAGDGEAVNAIKKGLSKLGYMVDAKILKAEEYGIPQERRRIIFVGNRLGIPILWPSKTHGPGLIKFTTVRDAIGDLPVLMNGENGDHRKYSSAAKGAYQKLLRGTNKLVLNHNAPKLSATNLERMKHIKPGGSWRDIPERLLPDGMKRAKRSDHTKRYGRLRWDGLASTILTKCDIHWGAYIHPQEDRSLTVREAARFQSFPDWFEFQGPRTEQFVQVGNAVPPILGAKLAQAILLASSGKSFELIDEVA